MGHRGAAGPCPPGRLQMSSSGLGTFGDTVRGTSGMWQKGRGRGEEPGGRGAAGRNLAGVREELKRPGQRGEARRRQRREVY